MAKKIVVINDWYGEDLKAEMRKAAEKAGFDIAFYETQEEAADAVADAEHGVHVVRVDDRRHVVLGGDVVNQFVNHQGSLGVQS